METQIAGLVNISIQCDVEFNEQPPQKDGKKNYAYVNMQNPGWPLY